ncbi:MAG: alpha/beta fold hydrolase [Desulfovibrio sp.]|jgi:carboxylesterase|nr:alpha/beta fold hydrolase [Desulfovibrio sp.]
MNADTACLLLHGFGGSPFEMEPLLPLLTELGCTVELPTLPGHDSSIEEFRRTFFKDWLGYAEKRFHLLSRHHKNVIPIGFSMGGSIALILAAKYDPIGVVSLAAPLRLNPSFSCNLRTAWLFFLPLLQYLRPVIPRHPSKPESRAIAPYRGYEGASYLPQLYSLAKGLAELREMLPDIQCPALLMHDTGDRAACPGAALAIARKTKSQELTLVYTRIGEQITSHHMLTTHRETRDRVATEVHAFVTRVLSNLHKR